MNSLREVRRRPAKCGNLSDHVRLRYRPALRGASRSATITGVVAIENVHKEALPEERHSRFWAFAFGAGAYAALLLAQ